MLPGSAENLRVTVCYDDRGARDLCIPPGELNAHTFPKGTPVSCSRKMQLTQDDVATLLTF